MAFTPYMEKEKINRIIKDLSGMIFFASRPVKDVCIAEGECPTAEAGKALNYHPFDTKYDHWAQERDTLSTFRIRCAIPAELAGVPVRLTVRTGRENQWNARNPQMIVFCNGELKQALDTNHTEILLSECAEAGKEYELFIEAWSGLVPGDCVFEVTMSGIHRDVEALYYDLRVGLEAALYLPEGDGTRTDELNALLDVCNAIDFRAPGSDAFFVSIARALELSRDGFYERFRGNEATVHCIGHTHIDVAWQWRLCHTRRKACRSFSTVNELMNQYPEYLFSSSQPQLYAFVKEDYPELYEKLRARIAEGRFEPEGSMWLEADCNIPSGESFVRQLLFGKRFFRDEFGRENHILWLPDVFGYSATLPQILKKSGIDCFITSKISWNEYNRMPNDTFLWEGIDGTPLLTHFHTIPDSGQKETDFFATYNGVPKPETIARAWKNYKNKDASKHVLASYGFGDGGGGPTREELEYLRRMKDGLPGIPCAKLDTKDGFVRALQKDLRNARHLPRWVGELYMEMHRGTFTTQAANKRCNRKAEFAYQSAEFLSAFVEGITAIGVYPRETFEKGWRTILLNQFHDIIPGSSIREVYEDSQAQYAEILNDAADAETRALKTLRFCISADGEGVAVFNKTGHTGGDVVTLDLPENVNAVRDPDGRLHPVQRTADGRAAFFAADVPGMGYRVFTCETVADYTPAQVLTANERGMTGRFARLRFDRNGNLSSVYDKKARRELLPKGERGNRLLAFEDRPRTYDAWDISVYYDEKCYPLDELTSLRVTECGPVFAAVELVRPYMNSTVRQQIVMYADSPRIDFRTEIDWAEKHTLLKVAFPADVHATSADYEIQFGNITRPTHANTSWEQAKFEVVGHKWADLSERDFGVSLLNDCKYGHDIRNGVLRLSLLRSPTDPDYAADQGHHVFTYSILPHAGGWREAHTPDAAYLLNNPFSVTHVYPGNRSLPSAASMVSADAHNVMIDTVKLAEDGRDLIIRLYEYENSRADVTLTLFRKIAAAWETDLMENNLTPLTTDVSTVSFTVKPYEIKTIRVRLR